MIKSGVRLAKIAFKAKKLKQLDDSMQREIAIRALANQFADAKGCSMKIGQFLASKSADSGFTALLKGIPAIPLQQMLPILEAALEQPLETIFKSIDEATSAASLGQVHHAILHNNEEVAVKIQYPNISARVHSELKIFGLMPGIGPVKKWGFDLDAYKDSFKNNMDRELDYRVEAASQQHYANQVQLSGLKVPRVYSRYTRKNILVQSWEKGDYLDAVSSWPLRDRKKVAEILLANLFKSLFDVGSVHCDPHIGNSFYRYDEQKQPEVILLDYGCILTLSEIQRLSLLKLIFASHEDQDISPLRYFVALGFDAHKLIHIADALPMLCRLLFKPFLVDDVFFTQHWQLEQHCSQLLNERRWWFRSAGPAQLFLIMRAFQGILQQLHTLQVNVSWSKVLQQSVSTETLLKAKSLNLPQLPQEHEIQTASFHVLAQKLHINVIKHGEKLVNVTLPAEMALDLKSLIPEDVLYSMQMHASIDLESIQQRIVKSKLAPQQVFDFDQDKKNYSVWLA